MFVVRAYALGDYGTITLDAWCVMHAMVIYTSPVFLNSTTCLNDVFLFFFGEMGIRCSDIFRVHSRQGGGYTMAVFRQDRLWAFAHFPMTHSADTTIITKRHEMILMNTETRRCPQRRVCYECHYLNVNNGDVTSKRKACLAANSLSQESS